MAAPETSPDSAQPKSGRLVIQPGQPLRFIEGAPPDSGGLARPTEGEATNNGRLVAAAIKAYREAAKSLIADRYSDLRELVPSHLREPCATTVILCKDGIIVRYDEAEAEQSKVMSSAVDATLAELAPQLSDSLIHLSADPASYDPGPGIELHLAKFGPASAEQEPFLKVRPYICVTTTMTQARTSLPPPHRPMPLVTATNQMEIVMSGVLEASEGTQAPQRVERSEPFAARGFLTLQVGWRAIEIFPPFDAAYWKSDFAALWAESDLLAAAARNQLRDAQFNALDPNLAARKAFANLLSEFEALLDGPEEPAHQFLKTNPVLLSPTHLKYWSKLPFGDRFSDFVFREPGGDYLLVEIEAPHRGLFRKDGQQRQELTHAFNQILDWRVYLENNLNAVREDLGLSGISPNPKSLVVIGRSSPLSDENHVKLRTLQNQIPNLRILTYDDLITSAKAFAANLFGPLDILMSNGEIYFAQSKARH